MIKLQICKYKNYQSAIIKIMEYWVDKKLNMMWDKHTSRSSCKNKKY